jgi:hypothetical protein
MRAVGVRKVALTLRKGSTEEETCYSVTLYTPNLTWSDLVSNWYV